MKKMILAKFALVAVLLSSCATEEIVKQEQNSFKVEKTAEMKHFEENLKEWFLSKKDAVSDSDTAKKRESIEKSSSDLLLSIGVNPDEISKKSISTEALISFTLKEYSKALQNSADNPKP